MPVKLAALLAVAGGLFVLLSTFFGVTPLSDWMIFGAQVSFAAAIVIFSAYVIVGIIRDANAM